jgi:hypothetical protein
MSVTLSPRFLADLAHVYATLRSQTGSAAFRLDRALVHATLPAASDTQLRFLANHLDEWRRATQKFVRTRLEELSDDDPLRCPISLFRTMDYGRLETAHTRTLAWLLDPKGEHGFGDTLLAALLRRLLGQDPTHLLRVERVESEVSIDGASAKGRLDVLAEGRWEDGERSGWMLVIEAKVDAWEGKDQLQKYEAWLRSNRAGRQVFQVFLTPDGREPDSGAGKWERFSYPELVRTFRAVYGRLRLAPGFHFLRFYLAGVLQDVCRWPRKIEQDDAPDPYAIASFLKSLR